jgi:hypothetical protein
MMKRMTPRVFLVLGIVQFTILISISMSIYRDMDGNGFDFWLDVLSDLSWNGTAAAILFSIAMVFLGSSIIIYWFANRNSPNSLFGAGSGIGLVGIGLSPGGFGIAAFGPISIAHSIFVIILTTSLIIAMFMEYKALQRMRKPYWEITAILYYISLFYFIALLTSLALPFLHPLSTILQKFMMFGMLFWYLTGPGYAKRMKRRRTS